MFHVSYHVAATQWQQGPTDRHTYHLVPLKSQQYLHDEYILISHRELYVWPKKREN